MWGFVFGVLFTTCAMMWSASRKRPVHTPAYEAIVCEVAIYVWETIPTELSSKASDIGGGSHGVSHTSIDICETDEKGQRLMIECLPGKGVIRSLLSKYEGRRHAKIIVSGYQGAEMRGCVRAKVGTPFDKLGILAGLVDAEAMMCSTLAYYCLPVALRQIVHGSKPSGALGVVVSPAQLIKAFGAEVGGPPVYTPFV